MPLAAPVTAAAAPRIAVISMSLHVRGKGTASANLIRRARYGNRRAGSASPASCAVILAADAAGIFPQLPDRMALAFAPGAAAQQAAPADGPDKRALETVHFASLDGKTDLTAYLGRHPGDAPRPAVVLMHGCSGLLNPQGRIFPIFRAWMRALFAKGYDVLTVDSAASRGFGQTCTAGPNRITMWRDRPKDAYAALRYLQAQPFVQADRIALMGWSQGGGVVLLTINDKSIGRPGGAEPGFQDRGVVLSRRLQRQVSVKAVDRGRAARLDHKDAAAGAVR